MDTRDKIVALEQLPGLLTSGTWAVVAGTFDPLTLVQAERLSALSEIGERTLAVVLSEPETLLTADARAALVAALRSVDAVVLADRGWHSILPPDCELRIIDDMPEERARTRDFVEFVKSRQRAAEPFVAAAK